MNIDGKKINSRITNGKFYVKGGGGWYTLKNYIVEFFIKKKASKKNHSMRKSVMLTDMNKSIGGDKSVRKKTTLDLLSSDSKNEDSFTEKDPKHKRGNSFSKSAKKKSSESATPKDKK
mmetsp:Transcript_17562/g.15478  ORF Transcript_17562/g.15478 Transcript_17562/m.15478 type:complete len:118 (-) Transcript_17562:11-364(-)